MTTQWALSPLASLSVDSICVWYILAINGLCQHNGHCLPLPPYLWIVFVYGILAINGLCQHNGHCLPLSPYLWIVFVYGILERYGQWQHSGHCLPLPLYHLSVDVSCLVLHIVWICPNSVVRKCMCSGGRRKVVYRSWVSGEPCCLDRVRIIN